MEKKTKPRLSMKLLWKMLENYRQEATMPIHRGTTESLTRKIDAKVFLEFVEQQMKSPTTKERI